MKDVFDVTSIREILLANTTRGWVAHQLSVKIIRILKATLSSLWNLHYTNNTRSIQILSMIACQTILNYMQHVKH